jgi:hypothetical protein
MEDVRAMFWLDSLLIDLPLCFGVWDEAVFHDIVAEAVSGLRVLSCRFHMGVANLIPELLQVGIWPCLEMLVKLWLVIAILDPEVNDLPSDTRGGKVLDRQQLSTFNLHHHQTHDVSSTFHSRQVRQS